jgi:hypothetical protein
VSAHAGAILAWVFAGLAVVLAGIGAVVAVRAAARTRRRLDEIAAAVPSLIDVERAQADVNRLAAAADTATLLLSRARAAIEELNEGLTQLRLPQAMLALRTAGAAIRLLFNGRA